MQVKRLKGSLTRGGTAGGALEGQIGDTDRYSFTIEGSLPIPAQEAASGIRCP